MLDGTGQLVRIYDYTEHSRWVCHEGKGYQIIDDLPRGVRVWTYFFAWASKQVDQPPMYRAVVQGFGSSKYFETLTGEDAEAMHARVLEKAARKVAEREKERAGAATGRNPRAKGALFEPVKWR